jgi:hypothetical protein
MAAPVSDFSDQFEQIARDETEHLRVRAIELRTRSERWAARGQELAAEAERLEARVRHLDELLGRAPQLRLDLQTQTLRGQQLREEAVRILIEKRGIRQPIHYREWYGLLRDQGLVAAGKDPMATFLTQITRSPLVERVDGGVYQVDPATVYQRARNELAEATRELTAAEETLAHVADGNGGVDENVAQVRRAQERSQAAQRRLDAILSARALIVREQLSAA